MKRIISVFLLAVLAGFAIATGGTAYLVLAASNKLAGTVAFTVGLFMVVTMGLNLYTGKVCYAPFNKPSYLGDVAVTWLGNFAGTFLTAQLLSFTRYGETLRIAAASICGIKLSDNLLSIFILSFFCNILIYIGVDGYRNIEHAAGKYLALFFGVCIFIICGFEHCVANMFYFSMASVWSGKAFIYLLVMTAGNAVGGIFLPLMRRVSERIAK